MTIGAFSEVISSDSSLGTEKKNGHLITTLTNYMISSFSFFLLSDFSFVLSSLHVFFPPSSVCTCYFADLMKDLGQ